MTLLKWLQWDVRTNARLQGVIEGEEMEASYKEHVFKNFGSGGGIVLWQ